MTNWIGKTLGKVHIESLLARGGMAEVYRGTHTTLQRKVAVKILRNYFSEDLHPQERFELEARAIASLRHPNIVQVFDFDTTEDQPYLVMEYIPGPSLSKYLSVLHKRGDRLGLPLVSRLLTRLADALQYAHESGVIHRDVKPGNILLSSRSIQIVPGETLPLDLEPVLTDFGLVRFLNSSRQTASGLITGTPAYMSPEQALGQATDGRTDIYSLGIVLYEMLSGKVPFDGETTMSILLKHINERPPAIPDLSPPIQRVLDRALAKSPADRFQTPDEFAAAFNVAVDQTSNASTLVTFPEALSSSKADLAPTRRKAWMPAVVAGALILLLGSFLLINKTSSPISPETATSSSPVSDTPVLGIPVTLGPTGILHFEDRYAVLDRATLIAHAMLAPPANSHYRVWLAGEASGEERLALGTLRVDESGRGELTYDEPRGQNLLRVYNRVEITIESEAAAGSNGRTEIVYAYALPEAGLVYLRGLVYSFPRAPEQVSLIHGLTSTAELINQASTNMLTEYQNADESGTRKNAEAIMNLLVGTKSTNHRDWNGDGETTNPGDGYGLLLNGDNLGYIQAVYSHADYALNSSGATRNMIINGENVKVCTENLARWVPELRDHMGTILNAGSLSGMDSTIQRSAELANQMLNGVDQNEDGNIEPVSEECGVLAAYKYAYDMADMPLLPVAVNSLETPIAITATVTPTLTATPNQLLIATPTKPKEQNGRNDLPATVAPTNEPSSPAENPPADNPPVDNPPVDEPPAEPPPPAEDPPGNGNNDPKDPKPTKEPKPTKNKD